MLTGGFGGFVAGVALIDVGRGHMQRQKMPRRIDGPMQLRAALAFGPVIAGRRTALGCRAQRPAVDDSSTRRFVAAPKIPRARPWSGGHVDGRGICRLGFIKSRAKRAIINRLIGALHEIRCAAEQLEGGVVAIRNGRSWRDHSCRHVGTSALPAETMPTISVRNFGISDIETLSY